MIPLRILGQTKRRPYFTFGLLAVNLVVFAWELILQSRGELSLAFGELALNPCHIGQVPAWEILIDSVRSMFFHGSWAHLAGNMLFLWIFGGLVEEYFGKLWFALFYFVSGFGAVVLHVLLNGGWCVPVIGASGAISGILAAFLLLYPGVRVKTAVVFFRFFATTFNIPALYMLGYWFVMQLFYGIASLNSTSAFGGVAFWAHVGGFVFGLLFTFAFTIFKPAPPVDPLAYLND